MVPIEAHFFIGPDGTVEQYLDSSLQAKASTNNNPRAISIQTWDGGDHLASWTHAQQTSLIELLAWCHEVHDIALHRVDVWDGPGIGGHGDFPGMWGPPHDEACLGDARINQIDVLIARTRAKVETADYQPGDRLLGLGSKGSDVAWVQQQLQLPEDGIFSVETHRELRRLQRQIKTTSDGIVGPTMWKYFLTHATTETQTNTPPRTTSAPITSRRPTLSTSPTAAHDIAHAILHHPIQRPGTTETITLAQVIIDLDARNHHTTSDEIQLRETVARLTEIVLEDVEPTPDTNNNT